ncbi:MAG: FAD-dependent oxidoreductase [bacterium]
MMKYPVQTSTAHCAVLVAGGGMAGIAAAIAAGRGGADVLLVEQAGWLGGMGITGATGLHSFFNVFDAHPGAPRQRLVAGIAQEIVDRTMLLGGALGHVRMERGGDFVSMLTPVEPEVFKLATFQLCREAGVRLLLHTTIVEAHAAAGHLDGVVIWNKAGISMLRAKVVIDCTGDGDLAAAAGAPFATYGAGDHGAYSAGFTFRLCNIDLTALEAELDEQGLITQLAHAVKPGGNSPELVRLGIDMGKLRRQGVAEAPEYFLSSSLRPHELTFCNCINYGPNDGLDPTALTNAEVYLHKAMFQVTALFRQQFTACGQCYPAGPSPSAGQRRGRAIRCEYELTQEDCTDGRRFDDEIALFGFIDNGKYLVREAGAYGIPYRALLPLTLDNVLIAGRMMTEELVAHNSTRNTVCCLACGQAAGTAAALAIAAGCAPAAVDIGLLRDRLSRDGALLMPKDDPLC